LHRAPTRFWLLFLLSLTCVPQADAQEGGKPLAVDLELILAVDVSRSMDDEEFRVQRSGYIDAIRHPEFIRAITSGGTGRIALTYIEWSTHLYRKVVVPWQLIDGAEAADAFAAALEAQPPVVGRGTSISAAIAFGSTLFAANDYDGTRRVIDVSGDGPNNYGPPVATARDAAVGEGIVINGLPILIRPSPIVADIARYYSECVIGGPGAFVLPVHKAGEFAEAIRRKLILEVAARPSPRIIQAAAEESADCLIGEKTRGRFTDQYYPGLDK
jgi:hypothetical protein